MKKRKPPIVAVTILIICLAVALGFNYKSGINEKAQAQAQQAQPTSDIKVSDPRPASSKSDIAKQVKAQAATPSSESGPAGGRAAMAKKMGMSGPSIEAPKFSTSKPVPNDTSVSSQWYQSDSSKAGN